jgi:hypothetical protein
MGRAILSGSPRFVSPALVARVAVLARVTLVIGIAASLAACDLMVASPSPSASRRVATPEPTTAETPIGTDEVPTIRPVPSGAVDLVGAADALADLRSYRASVVSRGLVPSSAPDGRVTMSSTLIQGNDPAAAFTLTGLDGFEGLGGGPIQAIVIGDKAWLRSGSGPWAVSPGGAADFDAAFTTLSPSELVSGFEPLAPGFVKVAAETRNGRETTHYRVDATDPSAGDAGLTSGSVDVWIDRTAGRLISIHASGSVDVDGTTTRVLLEIEVTHVDDPANKVRPPA